MSKSKGNVINPDVVVKQYGADTLRVYEMFMGPFEQMIPWDTKGVVGCKRFLEKIYKLAERYNLAGKKISEKSDESLKKLLHKTIKKVGEDIELMKFNTVVSSMMEFVNAWQTSKDGLDAKDVADFFKILCPLAPHLAEELWQDAGSRGFCCSQKWPKFNAKLIAEQQITLIVQINGKVRDKIFAPAGISEKQAEKLALKSEKIQRIVGKSEIKKTIFVADKLINIVIR